MLDPEDVAERIAGGEGPRLELKRALPRDERAARALCAFANGRGGLLVVGVVDRGYVVGVERAEAVVARLHALARERIEPPIALDAGAVRVAERDVVAARVRASRARPHAVRRDDGALEVVVRVGASNRAADGPTLASLRGASARAGLAPLEKRVVEWVQTVARAETATPARFAKARNVGLDRARRAFVRLEGRGALVAHGSGRARFYQCP